MKIAFFTDTYFPQINGVTYTVSLWKRELEKRGHEVFVYYPEAPGYAPGEREIPLKSLPFIFYKGYNIGLPDFKKVEEGFDVIHMHGFSSAGLFGLAIARKQGVPKIFTYHTPADFYIQQITGNEMLQESLKLVYYKYEKELLERCDVVTAPTGEIIGILKKRWGDRLAKTMHFSNGIDTDFFREVDAAKFREDFGIPNGRVVGFTGRHSKEKHLEDLINYADRFDGTVVLAGDGQQHELYKKMAEGKKNVIFTGFLPRGRMPEFYSSLDVFIMPSTAETEGLVVLEANACGKPTIGADAMGLKETIEEGVNGYRYAPGDMDDLGKKVGMAYRNLKGLKASSLARAKARSGAKTAEKLEALYLELIEEYKGKAKKRGKAKRAGKGLGIGKAKKMRMGEALAGKKVKKVGESIQKALKRKR